MKSSSHLLFCSTTVLILGVMLRFGCASAFLASSGSTPAIPSFKTPSPWEAIADSGVVALRMSEQEDGPGENRRSLQDYGFSDAEIERSSRKPEKEQMKVRVDMIDNIDATTLTAVGFGLVAFNFFVLANMGDGGIGGIVAMIINSF